MVRRNVRGVAWAGMLAAALLACGGGSSSSSTTSTTSSSTSSSGSTSAPPVTDSATTTTASQSTGASVDLSFTGSLVFQAKGSKGRCNGTDNSFSFSMTNEDYPGSGQGFSVAKLSGGTGDIKYVFDQNRAYASSPNGTLTFSSDLKSVQIDDELTPLSSGGGPLPGPVHVSGTISCP